MLGGRGRGKTQRNTEVFRGSELIPCDPVMWQEKKGTTEDEMVGWHHQLDGCEFEQALGGGEGQGSLVCYSPWGCKESDMTEQLNNNKVEKDQLLRYSTSFCSTETTVKFLHGS